MEKNLLILLIPDRWNISHHSHIPKGSVEYDDLDIDNGQEAMGAWGLIMRGMVDPSDEEHLRERLLRYCERDTEATVRILRLLREMATD